MKNNTKFLNLKHYAPHHNLKEITKEFHYNRTSNALYYLYRYNIPFIHKLVKNLYVYVPKRYKTKSYKQQYKMCWLHYKEDMTPAQIADKFGISTEKARHYIWGFKDTDPVAYLNCKVGKFLVNFKSFSDLEFVNIIRALKEQYDLKSIVIFEYLLQYNHYCYLKDKHGHFYYDPFIDSITLGRKPHKHSLLEVFLYRNHTAEYMLKQLYYPYSLHDDYKSIDFSNLQKYADNHFVPYKKQGSINLFKPRNFKSSHHIYKVLNKNRGSIESLPIFLILKKCNIPHTYYNKKLVQDWFKAHHKYWVRDTHVFCGHRVSLEHTLYPLRNHSIKFFISKFHKTDNVRNRHIVRNFLIKYHIPYKHIRRPFRKYVSHAPHSISYWKKLLLCIYNKGVKTALSHFNYSTVNSLQAAMKRAHYKVIAYNKSTSVGKIRNLIEERNYYKFMYDNKNKHFNSLKGKYAMLSKYCNGLYHRYKITLSKVRKNENKNASVGKMKHEVKEYHKILNIIND